ncbi:hypothetical protein CRG98_028983 [Punica granatum]|uniref:Uncharacterized protein n=1 Tax=Punica granatum TaxID=22663 RepID=A0A2I0J4C5_PUNGR|nr:hypothetical protein CRG98_028983 [Punica granatum]
MGPVELPGHVRPRLTSPIRVVFHINTTRSGTIGWTGTGPGAQVLGRGRKLGWARGSCHDRKLGRRREQLGYVFWAESRVS